MDDRTLTALRGSIACRKCGIEFSPSPSKARKHDYICLPCQRDYYAERIARKKAGQLPPTLASRGKCTRCGDPIVNKPQNRRCAKHLRFSKMQVGARWAGKSVPSTAELDELLPKDMKCPACKRTMNWFSKDGRSTMVTLQHDRNGNHRLICHACNSRHARMPGDSFYEIPAGHKYCSGCANIKPYAEFHKSFTEGRWNNLFQYCKTCVSERGQKRRKAA